MFISFLHRSKALCSTVAITAALAGCGSDSATFVSQKGVASAKTASELELAKSRYVAPDAPSGPLRERNGLFLAGNTTENAHGVGLPAKYTSRKYTFVNAVPMSFREVTDLVTRQTGIPVVARFTTPRGGGGSPQQSLGSSADITRAPTMAQGPIPAGFDTAKALAAAGAPSAGEVGQGGAALGQANANTMNVNFSGNLNDFLDLVGDTFSLGWEYEDGRLAFSRTQVATFDIPALPIVMKLAFALDSSSTATTGQAAGSSGGAQQSGGSSQKAATEAAFNLWTDIDKTIHSIVSSDGTVDISGSTGTVTINAPSIVVKQVRKYVQRINKELSREIVMGVDVYAVTVDKGDNYNFDLNVAFTNAANGGLGLGGGVGTATAAGTAIKTVSSLISNATNNGSAASTPSIGAAVLNPASKYYGSNALLSALSTQGDVSIVTSANLTTLNGIPAPFQVVNTRGYVASVATTSTGSTVNGGVSTSITPGSVTSGFNLYIVPRVDRNGSVMLQYGINISELVGATNGFDVFTTGGQTVQLPNINARNFVQEASVPVGDTLVLTGFEQKNDKSSLGGVGDPAFPFFGGSNVSSHERVIIVVAITPRIISFGQHNSVD